MYKYPYTFVKQEMIDYAQSIEKDVRVDRTRNSLHDTIIGVVGELIFLKWYYGDWKSNVGLLGKMGQVDIGGLVEIKASATSMQGPVHLLVREDYFEKRIPQAYVQVIFDTTNGKKNTIYDGIKAYIVGWCEHQDVANGKTFNYGYPCKAVNIKDLYPMDTLNQNIRRYI